MANVKYDTILSNFDNKLTLLQWLKNCDAYLKETETLYSDLSANVAELSGKIAELSGDVATINDDVASLSASLSVVDSNVEALDTRVTALENAPAPSGGTQLYKHAILITTREQGAITINLINNASAIINSEAKLYAQFTPASNGVMVLSCACVAVSMTGYDLKGNEKIIAIQNVYGEMRFKFLANAFNLADDTPAMTISSTSYSSGVVAVADVVTAL